MFRTYDLCDELRRLRLSTDRQHGQAQLQHHELLHSREILLTQPGVLHHHQLLEAAAGLLDSRGRCHHSINDLVLSVFCWLFRSHFCSEPVSSCSCSQPQCHTLTRRGRSSCWEDGNLLHPAHSQTGHSLLHLQVVKERNEEKSKEKEAERKKKSK